MFHVPSELYDELAQRLTDSFGDEGFYSGSVECRCGQTDCRLTASLVLYRAKDRWPEGERQRLADAVPVWWEFHTLTDGTELANDFSFAELKPFLLA